MHSAARGTTPNPIESQAAGTQDPELGRLGSAERPESTGVPQDQSAEDKQKAASRFTEQGTIRHSGSIIAESEFCLAMTPASPQEGTGTQTFAYPTASQASQLCQTGPLLGLKLFGWWPGVPAVSNCNASIWAASGCSFRLATRALYVPESGVAEGSVLLHQGFGGPFRYKRGGENRVFRS